MVAASLSTNLLSTTKPIKDFKSFTIPSSQTPNFLIKRGSGAGAGAVKAVANDEKMMPIKSNDVSDHQVGNLVSEIERGGGGDDSDQDLQLIGGLSFEGGLISGDGSDHDLQLIGGLSFEGGLISGDGNEGVVVVENEDIDKFMDRAINATIVLAVGTFGITKLLTIDYDYWHGWTIYEILRYAPQHNWSAYEEALRENPLLIKMMISGAVYSIGDWIAQCCEGKPLLEVDRTRMLRSGIVGFSLQGSLSHYYYNFCEALFPFHDWWLVPVKVAFDQTAWAGLWNIIYFVAVGLLRFESPFILFGELKETFWPMLTAGWKLWPFAHIITYGVVPIEHRLLWVDCVELIWVTILSTMSNEKSEARISDTPTDPMPVSSLESSEE